MWNYYMDNVGQSPHQVKNPAINGRKKELLTMSTRNTTKHVAVAKFGNL